MAGKAPTNIRKYFDGIHLNKPILIIEILGNSIRCTHLILHIVRDHYIQYLLIIISFIYLLIVYFYDNSEKARQLYL